MAKAFLKFYLFLVGLCITLVPLSWLDLNVKNAPSAIPSRSEGGAALEVVMAVSDASAHIPVMVRGLVSDYLLCTALVGLVLFLAFAAHWVGEKIGKDTRCMINEHGTTDLGI